MVDENAQQSADLNKEGNLVHEAPPTIQQTLPDKKTQAKYITALIVIVAIALIAFALGLNKPIPKSTTVPTSVTAVSQSNKIAQHNCTNFTVSTPFMFDSEQGVCRWGGGNLSIYYAAGNSANINFTITGANSRTYASYSSNAVCRQYYESVYLPAQNYTIHIASGGGGGSCGIAFVELLK